MRSKLFMVLQLLSVCILAACSGQGNSSTGSSELSTQSKSQTQKTENTSLLASLAREYPNGQLPAERVAEAAKALSQNPSVFKNSAALASQPKASAQNLQSQAFTPADFKPVYRIQNTTLPGSYFFTIYDTEKADALAANPNWKLEGTAFYTLPAASTDLSPVYRFRNKVNGSYLYTAYESEKADIQTNYGAIYELEGVAWRAQQTPEVGYSPLYRFRNLTNGTYLNTAYESEKDAIVRDYPEIFKLEGVAYYVLQETGVIQPIVYPTTTTVFKAPWLLVSTGLGGLVNDDIVFESSSDGISDDGSKVVFMSWSSHGFGLGIKSCTYDWIYVRDIDKKTLSLPVTGFDGKTICGYDSHPSISGNGKYVFHRGLLPPYSHSTSSVSGFFRTEIGAIAYEPVNRKGLEFSFENNGSLKVGTIIKGQSMRARPDTDGNSIVFSMKYLENTADVGRQYNSSLFANAMLRLDKGAQSVGNQSWTKTHDDTTLDYLNYEVSGNGTYVFYTELNDKNINTHRVWNMLSRTDEGDPFETFRVANPDANASMCGVSSDGRYVLVKHAFKVPLSSGRSIEKTGAIKLQLSRFDRINKVFEYAAVSEEQSRSINDGTCDYFGNGSFSRQMSKDGNRIFWRSGDHIFVRDMTLNKTLKIPFQGVAYDWTISGNGKYILLTTNIAPDGTKYLNKYGSATSQLYRFGPINDSDFGAQFTLESFENKLNQ